MPVCHVRQEGRHRRRRLAVETVQRLPDAVRKLPEVGKEVDDVADLLRSPQCMDPRPRFIDVLPGPEGVLVEVKKQNLLLQALGFLVLELGEALVLAGWAG